MVVAGGFVDRKALGLQPCGAHAHGNNGGQSM